MIIATRTDCFRREQHRHASVPSDWRVADERLWISLVRADGTRRQDGVEEKLEWAVMPGGWDSVDPGRTVLERC